MIANSEPIGAAPTMPTVAIPSVYVSGRTAREVLSLNDRQLRGIEAEGKIRVQRVGKSHARYYLPDLLIARSAS